MSFFKNISVAFIGIAIVCSMVLTAHTFANHADYHASSTIYTLSH